MKRTILSRFPQIDARSLFLIVVVTGPALFGASDPWNQFRGPNGSGVSETTGLPVRFGPNTNLVWKVSLPLGHSSPVLTSTQIFVTGYQNDQLLTLCLNRRSGALLWKRAVSKQREDKRHPLNDATAPSPVTDGENVYVFFSEFGLLSYDARGDQRWQLPLGPFSSMWGMGASPILVNDSIILLCDHDGGSFLLAVDKNTGRVRWRSERPGIHSGYSTPAVWMDRSGVGQLVVAGTFEIAGYSLSQGERLWREGGLAFQAKAIPVIGQETIFFNSLGFMETIPPQPSFVSLLEGYDRDGDRKISPQELDRDAELGPLFRPLDSDRDGFITAAEWQFYLDATAAENAFVAIRPGGKEDISRSHVCWKYKKSLPDVPSPLLYGRILYLLRNGGILTALDPETGTPTKQERIPDAGGEYYASPVAADGKVFLLNQDGKLATVKAGHDWEVLGVSDLGEECMATPALGDKRLFVRTRQTLFCFGKPK
jgi:outer membrane protein assembly factor BamB